jgi:hypothetical protein
MALALRVGLRLGFPAAVIAAAPAVCGRSAGRRDAYLARGPTADFAAASRAPSRAVEVVHARRRMRRGDPRERGGYSENEQKWIPFHGDSPGNVPNGLCDKRVDYESKR